jgi:hypothetical protein
VETPKIAGIPVGLPTDMPKAWFMALASLSKAATPERIGINAKAGPGRGAPNPAAAEVTKLVVGPFNRVEGDLEVTLTVADGPRQVGPR